MILEGKNPVFIQLHPLTDLVGGLFGFLHHSIDSALLSPTKSCIIYSDYSVFFDMIDMR